MNANEMYEYVERIANLIRTSVRKTGLASGLQPVQMEALHYLSRCNRYSNTPVAVAEFLGLTKGTVSQTLGVLETNGLVKKETDSRDRRVVHLHLTHEGEDVLQSSIPPTVLNSALTVLPEGERVQMERSIERLLLSLQRANGLKTFGPCRTCVHHQHLGGAERRCGLTREMLSDGDAQKICREHLPPP
ncbi:MarR family transcriptional regulator [Methyloparacoccus murrellii]